MVYHMISSLILDGNQLTISIYFNGIYIYIDFRWESTVKHDTKTI